MKKIIEYVFALICWLAIWFFYVLITGERDPHNMAFCILLSVMACVPYIFITIASRLSMVNCGISGFLACMISYFVILIWAREHAYIHGSTSLGDLVSDILLWIVPGFPIGMACYALVHRFLITERSLSKDNLIISSISPIARSGPLDWIVFCLTIVYLSPVVCVWYIAVSFQHDSFTCFCLFFLFYSVTMICSLFTYSWCSRRRHKMLNRISSLLHYVYFASPFLLTMYIRMIVPT